MLIIHLNITNSINDNEQDSWYLMKEEEYENFYNNKEEEKRTWDMTPGVRSSRYYYYNKYSKESFLDLTFDELKGLTIRQYQEIINS